jgi:hypothetical protein
MYRAAVLYHCLLVQCSSVIQKLQKIKRIIYYILYWLIRVLSESHQSFIFTTNAELDGVVDKLVYSVCTRAKFSWSLWKYPTVFWFSSVV